MGNKVDVKYLRPRAMKADFPDDADGDALRRLVNDGSDLTKPMLIDFQIAVPTEEAVNNG